MLEKLMTYAIYGALVLVLVVLVLAFLAALPERQGDVCGLSTALIVFFAALKLASK